MYVPHRQIIVYNPTVIANDTSWKMVYIHQRWSQNSSFEPSNKLVWD
jgi:hypothetical protein